MKIAQLAPPWLPVPPVGYGGTEAVVYNLTEELVKRGHEVTLFATLDSKTNAKLISPYKKALGIETYRKKPYLSLLHYLECFKKASRFDIIHNHDEQLALFLADFVDVPVVNTIHSSFNKKDSIDWKIKVVNRFFYQNFVSISLSQQKDLKNLNFVANIYNGIDTNIYKFSSKKRKYLFWLGRFSDKKGPKEAILTAQKVKIPLIMAGRLESFEKPFFYKEIMPRIDGKFVKFVGEVDVAQKVRLFSEAICTLCPIKWQEPFGLVMAESLSCGAPVVAFKKGSASELIENSVSGFVVESKKGVNGLAESVKKIDKINNLNCRERAESKFTTELMTDSYEKIYKKLMLKRTTLLDFPSFAVHN